MRNVRVIAELIPCSSAPVRRSSDKVPKRTTKRSFIVVGLCYYHAACAIDAKECYEAIFRHPLHSTPNPLSLPPRNISAPDGFILLIVFIFTAAPQSCQSVPFPNPRLCPPNFYASNKGNGGRMVDSILNPRWR